jgi:multidrug efflux pump subunit AcrB
VLVRARWAVVLVYVAISVVPFILATQIKTQLFPDVDTGQFQLRIRAKAGTRVEKTEELVKDVEREIGDEVGKNHVRITLANIGPAPWTAPVSMLYVVNAGPQEGVLLTSLTKEGRPPMSVLTDRLRKRLAGAHPDANFSFEAGDIVSQVLNLGATNAVEVNISGKKLNEVRSHAEKILAELRTIPSLRDVQIPQALDYPTIDVRIDRELAGQLGVTVDRVARSVVSATSSSAITTPVFWTDPATGVAYRVAIRVPENEMRDRDDLMSLPVMVGGAERPLLSDVATAEPGTTPGQITHYNSQRTVSVVANVAGSDLGAAARDVAQAIKRVGDPPRGVSVAVRGQVEEMRATLEGLRLGLGLAVVVILLLLAANFQSFRAPIAVVSTAPFVIGGVLGALLLTRSTLNVQSMMGAVMAIGVSVANAVLLVSFARERWLEGADQRDAIVDAAKSRLRPILMTSTAMMCGMLPMAIGLGEGGDETAPLGRAVIGGLLLSTIATLVFLPATYVVVSKRGKAKPISLEPTDEASAPDGAR